MTSDGDASAARVLMDPAEITVALVAAADNGTGDASAARVLMDPAEITVALVAAADNGTGDGDGARVLMDPTEITLALATADNSDPPAATGRYRTLADLRLSEPMPDPTGPHNDQLFAVVRAVANEHAGADGYGWASPDPGGEGVRVGIFGFPLASGELGKVLELTRERDPEAFGAAFAPAADALLATATAPTREERLTRVAGANLWDELWLTSFRSAGGTTAFRYAQNEHAVEHMVRPLVPVALAYGIADGGAFAVVVDRAVTHGVGGAVEWLERTLSPLTTGEALTAGLSQLGHADWTSFQATVPWLPPTGSDDALTRVALVGELRRAGALAPHPAALDALVVAAADSPRARRLPGVEGLNSISLRGVVRA